jgi:hypothetical protein
LCGSGGDGIKDGVLEDDIWFVFFSFVFSPLFFSFPDPPRRVEKNGASKGDATKIQMKNGLL